MSNTKRQGQILTLLENNQSMSVESIAEHFGVTPTSIRRDLTFLEDRHLISRSRGYAHVLESQNVSEFDIRVSIGNDEKRRIAAAAASLIKPRESVILDSGTTMLALAQHLKNSPIPSLSLITNSIPNASLLSPFYMVMMSGGIVHDKSLCLIGPDADHYFESIAADKAFIGATGVRSDVGLTAASPFQASIKRHMIAASSEVIALIDSSKFSTSGIYMFCDFSELSAVVTIRTEENERELEELVRKGVRVILA